MHGLHALSEARPAAPAPAELTVERHCDRARPSLARDRW
jgi:hypothetical protein